VRVGLVVHGSSNRAFQTQSLLSGSLMCKCMALRYYILGTPNGVRETAAAVIELAKKVRPAAILLEGDPQSCSNDVAHAGGKPRSHDGRLGVWVDRVLAYGIEHEIAVTFLATHSSNASMREQEMASQLASNKESSVLYVCGEAHAGKSVRKHSWLQRAYCHLRFGIRIPRSVKTCAALLPRGRTLSYHLVSRHGGTQFSHGRQRISPEQGLPTLAQGRSAPQVVDTSRTKSPFDGLVIVDKFRPDARRWEGRRSKHFQRISRLSHGAAHLRWESNHESVRAMRRRGAGRARPGKTV
jgi:hypothetical protein